MPLCTSPPPKRKWWSTSLIWPFYNKLICPLTLSLSLSLVNFKGWPHCRPHHLFYIGSHLVLCCCLQLPLVWNQSKGRLWPKYFYAVLGLWHRLDVSSPAGGQGRLWSLVFRIDETWWDWIEFPWSCIDFDSDKGMQVLVYNWRMLWPRCTSPTWTCH